MLNNTIVFLITFVVYLMLAHIIDTINQIIHETGHYISSYLLKLNPYFRYNSYGIPNGVWHDDSHNLLKENITTISGILAGILPILLYSIIFKDVFGSVFLAYIVMLYIFGCKSDLILMWKDIRGILKC